MKVLVAMSGGVDSSVAAAMLVDQGHDVTGVHLKLADGFEFEGRAHGCCSVADADDARRVAQVLDVPFYVWNLKDRFGESVIADFVAEYARGRTPNPCVRCNERVKFGALLERAVATGFDAVATGHYAVSSYENGRWRLYRSVDSSKDQSYVLARLGQFELAHALFPVGGQIKARTREIALELSLRTADKPDSYEICFVPDDDTANFVERQLGGPRPGPIVDAGGNEIGTHAGLHRYTVGQRRHLGLSSSQRLHVLELNPSKNEVVVGAAELLARTGLEAEDVRWVAGEPPQQIDSVVIRAHGDAIPATLDEVGHGGAQVTFEIPVRGVAPGQLVAFYSGNEVLGGGTIRRATS